MKKTVVKKVKKEILDDIICDICGESCAVFDCRGKEYETFEYLSLTADWGFDSGKDGERWEAQVCSSCADKHLAPLIKFQIKHD